MTPRKTLIEVALPLDAINKASAREKSIRHGQHAPGPRARPVHCKTSQSIRRPRATVASSKSTARQRSCGAAKVAGVVGEQRVDAGGLDDATADCGELVHGGYLADLVKPPKTQRLPDIVTVQEAARLFAATRCLSYRVFCFTDYSMSLRLGEGLALRLGDIDAARARVQVRDAKGNRDRLVPLPQATLAVLRRFWLTHRHPELLFPNRSAGLKGAQRASSPLDRGGVQLTLRKVATACGLKKRSPLTVCATAMPRT